MDITMTRAKLAKELGVTTGTVIYYTRIGLFPYELRHPENPKSRKLYDISECRKIWEDICQRRAKGIPLSEVVQEYSDFGMLTPTSKV